MEQALLPALAALGSVRMGAPRRVAPCRSMGPTFASAPGSPGSAFGALAAAGINILAVSTSISTVSCVVEEALCDVALRTLQGFCPALRRAAPTREATP